MSRDRTRSSVVKFLFGLAALFVTVSFAACSSVTHETTEPEDQGEYSASIVAGDNTLQLSGKAVFGTTQNSSGLALNALYLWTGEPGGVTYNVIWFQRQNLETLEPGDYAIVDVDPGIPPLDDFLSLYAYADATSAATFHSVSGTLTISSYAIELTGTFEFVAAFAEEQYHSGVVADTVLVSGSFRAVPGTIY